MKNLVFFFLVISGDTLAQSPYLSVQAAMDNRHGEEKQYKIELKFCSLRQPSKKGSWFIRDTSSVNFNKLQANDLTCGKYSGSGDGVQVLSGKEFAKYNSYEFSNQVSAWEMILVFRISDSITTVVTPPMYIVLPIKYKSFVTHVRLDSIRFQPGSLVFIEDAGASYELNSLMIKPQWGNMPVVLTRNSPLKEWVE